MDLVLDREAFISILKHSLHLSFDSPLNMVYELLQYCFVLDDFASGLDFCFEICRHIACGHVPPSVSQMFVTTLLLVLGKQVEGVRPIMIGKVICYLVAYTLVIQFKDTFAKHFSPHQFGVAMSSKCKTIVHGVVLDLHSEWLVL
jgi:hypothetical protein